MGAINNAFNQAAGAVAGAALATKHAQESDFSKMNTTEHSALIARNQASAAEAEANEFIDKNEFKIDEKGRVESIDISSAKAKMDVKKAEDALFKSEKRKNASRKTILKKMDDLEAAISARKSIVHKIKAMNDMKARAKEQRAYADKATELAKEAQQRYQSKWGGNK